MRSYKRVTYIYVLRDDDAVRYVGKANEPYARLSRHINQARKNPGGRHVWSWIVSLLRDDKEPKMDIVACVEHDEWQEAERYWIKYYEDAGCELTNMTAGGYGMLDMSEDIRRRIGEAASWHHANDPEFHATVMDNLAKGSHEHLLEYKFTEEDIVKLSKGVKRSWDSDPERKKRMSARVKKLWRDGVLQAPVMTKETRKKISDTLSKVRGVDTTQAKLNQEQVYHIRDVVYWEERNGRKYFNFAVVKKLAIEYDVSTRVIRECATYKTY